jgi:hypothetical protein
VSGTASCGHFPEFGKAISGLCRKSATPGERIDSLVLDQILAYDFDLLVPGHHSNPSTRDDVKLVSDYVMDVYDTVKRIHEADHRPLTACAARKYGSDNSYAIARVLLDSEVAQAAKEIKRRWATTLIGVDVWVESHCRTALVYFVWDVGPGQARRKVFAAKEGRNMAQAERNSRGRGVPSDNSDISEARTRPIWRK